MKLPVYIVLYCLIGMFFSRCESIRFFWFSAWRNSKKNKAVCYCYKFSLLINLISLFH